MDTSILLSITGAAVAGIGGWITTLLAEKFNRKQELEKETLDEALAATTARLQEIQTELARTLADKIPEGASATEIKELLSTQFRVGGDLIVNHVTRESSDLIGDLVKGYHQQALSQARVQFWFSVIAATVGFGYILFAASTSTADQFGVVLKILPGVVIDVVAALFFRQSEQTRQRATELYDRLRTDSHMSMAQRLLTTIDDVRIRSVAQAQIALHMAGLKPREIDVAALISTNNQTDGKA